MIWSNLSSFEIGKNSRQIRVWQKLYKRCLWNYIATTFKFGCILVMVWNTFTSFAICPLVIMLLNRRTSINFVTGYDRALSGFYFLYNHLKQLKLMEDRAPIYCSLLLLQ